MRKYRRTPARRRPPLSVEYLESRESPTNLTGLMGGAAFGAAAVSVAQHAAGARGGGDGIRRACR